MATFAGFYLALPAQLSRFPWMLLIYTLLGTLLVAGGTGTLNQYIERRFRRTDAPDILALMSLRGVSSGHSG